MLRGLTTVSFFADDVMAAQNWYTKLLGIEPYFARPAGGRPAYVAFRIGDYQHELGIVDSRFAPHGRAGQAGGAVIYWHVDDVRASVERLVSMGHSPRGAGRARARVRHRIRDRSIREHPRGHVQPALPGDAHVAGGGVR
jgi:predicted enzyme related to lactoylglutathione lyase